MAMDLAPDVEQEEDQTALSVDWWVLLSPRPLTQIIDTGKGKIRGKTGAKLRLARLAWVIVLILLYVFTLTVSVIDQDVMSGVRQEVMDEFFPDAGKASERIKEGEVTAGAKELMHADDVAQTLTWFTTFCRLKAATDDHIKASWSCSLDDIVIGDSKVSRWDAVTNRALSDDVSDSPHKLPKRGIFSYDVTEEDEEKAERRMQSLEKMCDKRFLEAHMVIGDDPHGDEGTDESPANFKDPEQFTENYLKKKVGMDGLAEDFEELGGDPAVGLDQIVEQLESLSSPRPASPSLLERRGARRGSSRGARHHLGLEEDMALEEDDNPLYSSGCFDSSDYGGILAQVWEEVDADGDRTISINNESSEIGQIIDAFGNKTNRSDSELLKLIKRFDEDHDDKLDLSEFIECVMAHPEVIQIPGRGFLTTKCRNHHFGLLSVCKPTSVSAKFRISNVERKRRGAMTPRNQLLVKINFLSLGAHQDSGWYRLSLEITSIGALGEKGLLSIVLMCTTLLLVLVIFLGDFLATVLYWPLGIWRLYRLHVTPDMSFTEAAIFVRHHLLVFLDVWKRRSRIMSTTWLFVEFAISVCFTAATLCTLRAAVTPLYIPPGTQNHDCFMALLKKDAQWMDAWVKGQHIPRGLSPIDYITYCRDDLTTVQKIAEYINSAVFEQRTYHGFVIALLCLRFLEVLEHSSSLRWLPKTLSLALPKIVEFMLVYVLLIGIFSAILSLQFGFLYSQFNSIPKTFLTLLLYSFAATERALEGVHPFIEFSGTLIAMYLLIFTLIVVTICLNVFTTIVIDAYTVAQDPEAANKILEDRKRAWSAYFVKYFSEPDHWKKLQASLKGALTHLSALK
eukprot:TRINITY_DN12293_c0_g1_i2.p1 TRINITY_DN12293_c0_g1~~TRINITY_DN12293_c0_g1_i2.p1  ORF type:complete len:850 (-),score=163.18 TRINITY_DN12293_c0_g1_i2:24-2573(-)